METYFLCCACGSLEYSSIDVDLCTRCGRRYCSTHRRTHPCDDSGAPRLSPGMTDVSRSPTEATATEATPPQRFSLTAPTLPSSSRRSALHHTCR